MDDRILLVIAGRGSLPLSLVLIRYLYVLSCYLANLYYHGYTAQIYIICGISIIPTPRSLVVLYQLLFAICRVKYMPHTPNSRRISRKRRYDATGHTVALLGAVEMPSTRVAAQKAALERRRSRPIGD